jgi:ribosomal 50S subunit-recycling heat shock protein
MIRAKSNNRKSNNYMRLDKYLKVSRIIKRRTIANEAADAGRVSINGKVGKPSTEVKEGDTLDLLLGGRHLLVRVESLKESVHKEDAAGMYTVLSGDENR